MIAIFAENSIDWILSEAAIHRLNLIPVPFYATLKKDVLELLKLYKIKNLIVSEKIYRSVIVPNHNIDKDILDTIIIMDNREFVKDKFIKQDLSSEPHAFGSKQTTDQSENGIRIIGLSLDDYVYNYKTIQEHSLEDLEKELEDIDAPKPNDLYMRAFTSGTTSLSVINYLLILETC